MHPSQEPLDLVIAKIKHYLITMRGKVLSEASNQEFYTAFCLAIREQITLNWAAMEATRREKKPRTLYYLSLEYLPGRFIINNIYNAGSESFVLEVLKKCNRKFIDLISAEWDPGLGNGGLGRLAACMMESLATKSMPARGYGLRYQYGIFEQEIWDGIQIERPDIWLYEMNPWERRNDSCAVTVRFADTPPHDPNLSVDELWKIRKEDIVRALPFDYPIVGQHTEQQFPVLTLRLWSTEESPGNFKLQRYNSGDIAQAAENLTLTNVLYPNDNNDVGKRIRLKQEFLLVSASVQDIFREQIELEGGIHSIADKVRIQMNDTHPALAVAEMMRILTQEHRVEWKKALDTTIGCCSFTIHTVLKEAHEQWSQGLLEDLLPYHHEILKKLNEDVKSELKRLSPDVANLNQETEILWDGMARMTPLAIFGSHKVNGVARLHTEILKQDVCRGYYSIYPERFVNVTNGVTHRKWLLYSNPSLAALITKCIGKDWVFHFDQIKNLSEHAGSKSVQEEFLKIKRACKERLIEFLKSHSTHRDERGEVIHDERAFNPESLFDIQIKRIHEYKRQLMNILHVVMLYHEMLDQPRSREPRTIIFAGKAAPGYQTAKNIIRFINCVARKINQDPALEGRLKVIFIENYNVSRAQFIIPAADLSEQISTAGLEASGTGNMKLSMNGALTIGTEDGANIEMRESVSDAWWPFRFGLSSEEISSSLSNKSYNPHDVLENHPAIKRAVDSLMDGTFSEKEDESASFASIYNLLVNGENGDPPDKYFVLADLITYAHAQRGVDELYRDPLKWAEHCLHNVAGMGPFSIDRTIDEYSSIIWEVSSMPVIEKIYKAIREQYVEGQ
jgi:starch phosphorylase